jgi:tetratricopeptide (TPR) repeat protein
MHPYGMRTVETLLRLPRSTIRSLIAAGFVAPARGPRGALRFSFQDLIVLRSAWALTQAGLSSRRILRALKRLRALLPDDAPLSGLRIAAVGDQVVVQEGDARWQADSGQYVLALDVGVADGVLSVTDHRDTTVRAEDWFAEGAALEDADPQAAERAYAQALAADPGHHGAAANLGRLLHAGGRLAEAERVYRAALDAGGSDALLHYNLGVLLEDAGRADAAAQCYERALADDDGLADCHYNLARLRQAQGRQQDALRHFARYRKLSGET